APVLDAGMRAVLRRIHDRNVVGEKPSLSTVGRELHLSRPTVRWRVRRLAERGFIRVAVSGRRKTLELTEQGWRFFTE
ncbi:MAG: winged helix-turn-helix transcriptional regulator, partial [Thermoplasmatota archaeon]